MMGQQPRTDSLLYYFRLEDQIPDDHLLKRLDRFIDFGFVRERLRDTYSAIGRPSIDLEVLLRLLLVGYPYGITARTAALFAFQAMTVVTRGKTQRLAAAARLICLLPG
jgi:transposase